jgi:tetratricopeptide (TPR) repeat protein
LARATAARRALYVAFAIGMLLTTLAGGAVAAGIDEGQQLYFAGKYADCVEMAEAEIDRGNYLEQWRVLKIRSELATGSLEAALASADRALDEYPTSLPLRFLAHTVYQANGQASRAATELEMIERLALSEPRRYSSPASRLTLGRYFLKIGADARQVLEIFYDPIVKGYPEFADAHLASAELSLAKYDNALAADVLAKAPDAAKADPDYHYLRARAFVQDDAEAATEAITAALSLNPHHVKTLLLQVDNQVDAEQYDTATELLEDVLETNPREPLAWAYKAVLAHLVGDADAEQEARRIALADWPDNPEVDHTIGRKLSDKYRFAEGAAYQRQALKMDAAYLPAKMQLAQDLLRLGEEDEGWQLATSVFDADGYNVVAHNLVTLHDTVKQYKILANESFRVRMEAREAAIYGDRVLALLDRAKQTLCDKYDLPLDRVVAIEIFPEQKDFAVRTFGLPGADGFLGVCFGNVITANSPAALGQTSANWEAVLWHEFCHVITLRKSRNKMPRWLSEGISVYEEREENPAWGQVMTPEYRALILADKMPPVSQLSAAFLSPESPMALQFAYYESSLVVEFIVEEHGVDSLKQVLTDLGNGVSLPDALARNGLPLNRLDKEFNDFARERAEGLASDLSWEPAELEDDADADAIAAWLEDHPDNFMALMALGRALQREERWQDSLEPAKQLREKFPDFTGAGSGYLLLSRAYRELDQADAEREVLEAWAARASDVPEVYERLAELAAAEKDWAAVELNARRALAVNPLTPAPHRWLAQAADALDHPDDAIDAQQALLQFDTADPVDAHYRLAVLLNKRGDQDAALSHVMMALEDAPRYLEAHRLLLELTAEERAADEDATEPAGDQDEEAAAPADEPAEETAASTESADAPPETDDAAVEPGDAPSEPAAGTKADESTSDSATAAAEDEP